jgi:flagellar basal-body rod modification protein FlgD
MDVTTILNSTNGSAQTSTATKTVDKNDFLKLFVTQLQYQNPLSPMDSTGFTSQLAQFSSLEQLTNINAAMSNLTAYQNSMQNTLAAGLIGKTIKVSGNQVSLAGTAALNYSLTGAAAQTKISIYDSTGKCVRQADLGNRNAGAATYTWDGKDSLGNTLPDGAYTFSVDALDTSGAKVCATTLTYGVVTGIVFENNATYLMVDGKLKVRPGDIQEITS